MPQPVMLKKLKLNGSMKTYDLLELTPPKDVFFILGDWNAKLGSQETPGVTGKFGLGMWNEAGQRLIEFCKGLYIQVYILCIYMCLIAQSCLTLCDPMDCSPPGGFSKQEYWSGLP